MIGMTLPKNYIVWDLETTGFDPIKDYIIEIGVAMVRDGEIVERKNWLLNHGIEITEKTTEVTGITKELIDSEGRDPAECLSEFMQILQVDTPHLTHNGIRFDIPFLVHALIKHFGESQGGVMSYTKKIKTYRKYAMDTAVFVKAKKLGMEWKWGEDFARYAERVMSIMAKRVKYSVDVCCEEMNISKEGVEQHRALGDVELTNKIYQYLTQQS